MRLSQLPKHMHATDAVRQEIIKGEFSDVQKLPRMGMLELLLQLNGEAHAEQQSQRAKYGENANKCKRLKCRKPTPKSLLDKRGYCPECAKVVRPYCATGTRNRKGANHGSNG